MNDSLCGGVHDAHRRLDAAAADAVKLHRRLALLAAELGVDIDVLEARDELVRRDGYVVEWSVLELAGIDPATGKPTGPDPA